LGICWGRLNKWHQRVSPKASSNQREENFPQRPLADALRMELAAAGDNQRVLRAIARNLIAIASSGEPIALQAIKEIADRTDGKARQTTEVTRHNANARELSDDDLAAIAVGADVEDQEIQETPQTDLPKLN
jgi:hypothetical protein